MQYMGGQKFIARENWTGAAISCALFLVAAILFTLLVGQFSSNVATTTNTHQMIFQIHGSVYFLLLILISWFVFSLGAAFVERERVL